MIQCPCYDTKTGRDCPNRGVGCHVNCEKWHGYLEKRDKIYAENKRNFDEKTVEIAYNNDRYKRLGRKKG